MRPKKHETTDASDLFRARLDQIINMKHELVQLAGKLDWEWLDGEIAPLYSDKGRPGIKTRFVIGLLLLKHIFALSDEEVCERWVYDPYFQYFTGEEFFQHAFPHERSDLSHWRKRLGDKLELLLAESLRVAPRRCRETPTMATRSAPSSKPPKGSPDVRSSAPMSTRDIAATMRPIRAASSSLARSAASSASSSANCGAAPPSKL